MDTDDRVLLAKAIVSRADDVGLAVVQAWRTQGLQVGVPQQELEETIHHTSQVGAELIGRWLGTGEGASPDEAQDLAERSTGVIRDHFAMHGVVKNYLTWRDATLRVVREEAARLGAPEPLVAEVSYVVRRSADISIVNVIREYDDQLRGLQNALALERAKLTHLALHDPLTGLANRTLVLDRLTHALAGTARGSEQVGVLFLDLNGFKAINDRFGHAAGDRLLMEVAERLVSLVRPSDTVGRLGGDEFVVIGVFTAPAERTLMDLTSRVREGIAAPAGPFGDLRVTASIGAAIGDHEDDPEQVLARADTCMYADKQQPPASTQAVP